MASSLLPGKRSGHGSARYRRAPMGEINVTPFVDVMLVLLIVFMISAPLLTQGVQVDLPETASAPLPEKEDPIEISVKAGGEVYLQAQKISTDTLGEKLTAIKNVRENAPIVLRADKDVAYGMVMNVMATLQNAGFKDVGMVTEPPGSGKR